MKNPLILLLVLIGVAVAALAAFLVLQPGGGSADSSSAGQATSAADVERGALIPDTLPGFKARSIERAEPSFEGELFSVHAQFSPTPDSPYAGTVESLGVSVFRLSDPDAGGDIKEILTMGEPEARTVADHEVQVFVNEGAGLAGALWQRGVDVYLVLASGAAGDDQAQQQARDAVMSAAEALLGGRK